ncbi:MAG: hypothetical protein LBT41_03235 [Candidatus Methanoplasma sp.]|jgi:hypothetical protein|nr:hypothetical protein [Candidatus Methanoplasma sp.]
MVMLHTGAVDGGPESREVVLTTGWTTVPEFIPAHIGGTEWEGTEYMGPKTTDWRTWAPEYRVSVSEQSGYLLSGTISGLGASDSEFKGYFCMKSPNLAVITVMVDGAAVHGILISDGDTLFLTLFGDAAEPPTVLVFKPIGAIKPPPGMHGGAVPEAALDGGIA